MMRSSRGRLAWVAASLLVLITGVGTLGSVGVTESAWTDKTFTSAVATGGTWSVPASVGCVAMNANGTPKKGGRCSVASVEVSAQWGTAGNRTRNYTVNLNSNANDGYIQFTIDLSVSGGAFAWSSAGVVAPAQQVTPNNGWTCAQLPILTGRTPSNWGWHSDSTIFFQIAENRASASTVCG